MKEYQLDPLPDVTGDPAELFFDDREDCEFARTLAARTAAIISQVRRYTVTRYTYPGRQIIVAPSTRTPGGWQVTFYHTDPITPIATRWKRSPTKSRTAFALPMPSPDPSRTP